MSLVAGGGIVAAIMSFWSKIQGFFSRIISIVIKTDAIQMDNLLSPFVEVILKNCKRISIGNSTFCNRILYLKNYQAYAPAIFESPFSGFYTYGRTIIFVNFTSRSISYLRGTFDIKPFLQEIVDIYRRNIIEEDKEDDIISDFHVTLLQGSDSKKSGRRGGGEDDSKDISYTSALDIPKGGGGGQKDNIIPSLTISCIKHLPGINFIPEDIGEEKKKIVDRIFFSQEAEKLYRRIHTWYKHRNWFRARNIPHRGGALLYGPPGSGKSQTIKEICRKLGLRLYLFDLSTMSNQEFHNYFTDCYQPCVIVFEDIDSVFKGRENVVKSEFQLTFDCFINHLSGILDNDGKFIIVTTNHPESIDPALLRSGRLDEKFELAYLCEEGKRFLAEKILKDWDDEVENLMKDGTQYIAADFENKCIQIAVERFWKDKEL